MVPALRGAPIVGEWAGLRPSRRPEAGGLRLEKDPLADAALIHNYGHGGSGVLCSWGCAAAVTRLAARVASDLGGTSALRPVALPRLLRGHDGVAKL